MALSRYSSKSWFLSLKYFFIADHKKFTGSSPSIQLKKDAEVTASAVTISNALDFFSNFPLLYFAFEFLGFSFCFLVTLLLSLGILKFGNEVSAAIASQRRGGRFWSITAIAGLLSLNVVQSVASGIGFELLNNRQGLAEMKANELVTQQEQLLSEKISTFSESSEYLKMVEDCDEIKNLLRGLNRESPEWTTRWVEAYGLFDDRYKTWTLEPISNVPKCKKPDVAMEKISKPYKDFVAEHEKYPFDDLEFLKAEYPNIYNKNFANDELRSGVTAAEMAITSFLEKTQNRNYKALGFSLFMFSISSITSVTACFMTIAHGIKEETEKSRYKDITTQIEYSGEDD